MTLEAEIARVLESVAGGSFPDRMTALAAEFGPRFARPPKGPTAVDELERDFGWVLLETAGDAYADRIAALARFIAARLEAP